MSVQMTSAELEKIHVEIAKLMAETSKINEESRKLAAESARINNAEVAKLIAETKKLNREVFWYPMAIASGLVGAVAAVTALIVKAL